MFHDLLDQPRRETEALRAQCAAQEKRLEKLESLVVKCAAQEKRIKQLESVVVKCAMNSRTSIIALKAFGITPVKLKANEFTPFKDAGFTCEEYKHAGYMVNQLKLGAFTVQDVKDAGFTLAEIWPEYWLDKNPNVSSYKNQYNFVSFKHAGFTREELISNSVDFGATACYSNFDE